ncbi:MAG: hypothetical protein ACLQQ4_07890 [Bacteroidia bacterium]
MAASKENTRKNKLEQWKIRLADAILEEAGFSGCPIREGADIEHQLGTVWVGEVAISSQATGQDAMDRALEKSDVPQE